LHFLAVNEAAVSRYAYSRDEFLGMTIKELRIADEVAAAAANESPSTKYRTGELVRHRWKDGTERDVELSSHPLRHGDRPARLVLALDVTERRQAEEAIRRAQLRLQHVVASSPAVLLTLAVDGTTVNGVNWVSDNLSDVFGYAAGEALQPDWWLGNIHPE